MFQAAQVIVTEGERGSCISEAIAAFTDSWATHAFLVTLGGQAVEATFPRVAPLDYAARLQLLEAQDRAYAVLDLPNITADERRAIANKVTSYIGRWYDLGQLLLFAATGRFWGDGTGTLDCSRLITGAYAEGANVNLFSEEVLEKYKTQLGDRIGNLRHGFPLPAELLTSKLEVVAFHPSSRIRAVADFLPR